MVRKTGASLMIERIKSSIIQFVNMNSEQRIEYIRRYKYLQPYQTTALLQCKRYMTTAERKELKKVQAELKSESQKEIENQTPPQMV